MDHELRNCWEIMECGRESGGKNVAEFGVCVAAREGLGHSCWAVAGTLCGGEVQGSIAQKEADCMSCELYMLYHRQVGIDGEHIPKRFPDEEKKYSNLLRTRLRNF